jgi:hypothetical protein
MSSEDTSSNRIPPYQVSRVSFALPLSWMLLLFVSAWFLMKWQHEGVLLVPAYFVSMVTFFWRKQDGMSLIKEQYFTCFGTKLWGHDKPRAPYTACHCCVPMLSQHAMVWLESRSLSHYHHGHHKSRIDSSTVQLKLGLHVEMLAINCLTSGTSQE